MKKLEWRNLQDGFCPKCYEELEEGSYDNSKAGYFCKKCLFNITKERHDEIVGDMEKDELLKDEAGAVDAGIENY